MSALRIIKAGNILGALLLVVFLSLVATVLAANAQRPAKDPVHLPDDVRFWTVVANRFWQTNCYILAGKDGDALVIDPSDEMVKNKLGVLVDPQTGKSIPATAEQMAQATDQTVTDPLTGKKLLLYDTYTATGEDIKNIYNVLVKYKLTCKYIVLTHGHIDHIAGVGYLKERTGAKLLMNRADTRAIDGGKLPPAKAGEKIDAYPKDAYTLTGGLPKVHQFLANGDLLKLDGMVFQVLNVPGHSAGSICLRTCYKGTQIIFDGDTLFYHTIGRTDFRDGSGDHALLLRSIREKLLCYPDNTILYPGHYLPTTVGEEKRNHTLELLQNLL